MTKRRGRPYISIRIKILLAIMAVVAVVIATVWVLQVLLLERFYLENKRSSLMQVVGQISRSIDQEGIAGTTSLMSQLASENAICIDVGSSDIGGREFLRAEGIGDSCYVHMNWNNRAAIVRETYQNAGDYLIITIRHERFDTRYMVCSIAAATPEQTPYIVIATASLSPLQKDVTPVIREQLYVITPPLILAAAVIAFLFARSITRPLCRISEAARKIAENGVGVSVQVRGNDEIGDLARDFNIMSREIAKVNTLQREIIANISHDIRTPLTMIKGYAETIKDITGDDKEAREQQLDIIVEESDRLSVLVSDVMDLSLMQAGQTAFHPTVFDITEKAESILSRYQLLEQTKGFAFCLEAEGPFQVEADGVRIEQVLYNLINNAVNHIGEEKRITVRILPESQEEVRVEVTDTGAGIRQEDLPLIWDRYYKSYKGKTSMGTGLGLSIVKAILVNHRSRFGVNSTLGVGSTFWFTLKRA